MKKTTKQRAKESSEKPVALTLRIDSALYVRLSMFSARERRTHQDILKQALEDFLKRYE